MCAHLRTTRTLSTLSTLSILSALSRHPRALRTRPLRALSAVIRAPLHTHRTQVSIEAHTFDMDFYLTEEWKDARNYGSTRG